MHPNKGHQKALFTDKEVRRDYFKSQQWIKQHVVIKHHLTGWAVCYNEHGGAKAPLRETGSPGRPQGSLYNQQKAAIADAVEWIRQNSKYKPRIFVATTPGFLPIAKEGKFISKLVHNLKNGYGMQEFVWVREYTKKGFPHFHFVADVDRFDAVRLSEYWSGLFGVGARNSVRLGSKPDANGRRRFWIDSSRGAWYLTKYIGKALGEKETLEEKRPRAFAISQLARRMSAPLEYQGHIALNFRGRIQRAFFLNDDQVEEGLPYQLNPYNFRWKWTGHYQTFVGFSRTAGKNIQKTA